MSFVTLYDHVGQVSSQGLRADAPGTYSSRPSPSSRSAPHSLCSLCLSLPIDICSSQTIRGYSSEAQAPRSSSTPWIVGAAAVGTGILGYNFLGGSSSNKTTSKNDGPPSQSTEDKKDINKQKEEAPIKTFTGGEQGFIDLKLKEIIPYNHNTKRFKFALPDEEAVSGLNVACKWRAATG